MKEIKIYEIPNIDFIERIDDPYIGMIFYVADIDTYYSVKTLKEINGINMKGSKVVEYVIDDYADFGTGSGGGSGLTATQLSNIAKIPAIQSTVDALPNNYASKNHNHSEYASSSHRHNASEIDNLPSSGGTGLTTEQANNIAKIPSMEANILSNTSAINNRYTKSEVDAKISNIVIDSGNRTVANVSANEEFVLVKPTVYAAIVGYMSSDTVNEGTYKTIKIALKGEPYPEQVVTITSDSPYLTATPAQLTFNKYNWNFAREVRLNFLQDKTSLEDKTVNVTLSTPNSNVSSITKTYTIKNTDTEITNPVAVESVTLSDKASSIEVGKSKTVTATVLPSDASDSSVRFSLSNNNYATLVSEGNTATVTGTAAGSVNLVVTANADASKTDTCVFTVTEAIQTPVAVQSVTLDANSKNVDVGKSVTLTATINPTNATNQGVTFASNNANCTVTNNGLVATVTGVTAGSSIITVTTDDGSKTASCNITVNEVVFGDYVTDGLALMYDLTQYEDGYTGDVIDSVNNVTAITTGLENSVTGRNGFIGGKLMLNHHRKGANNFSTFAVPHIEAISNYPYTIESYMTVRNEYSPYAPNGILEFGNDATLPTNNQIAIDLRSTIDTGNATKGFWFGYKPDEKTLSAIETFTNNYIFSDPIDTLNYACVTNTNVEYHHFVYAIDTTSLRIYFDGVKVLDKVINKTLDLDADKPAIIKIDVQTDLKLFRVYNKQLSDEEVTTNYNNVINTMGGNN